MLTLAVISPPLLCSRTSIVQAWGRSHHIISGKCYVSAMLQKFWGEKEKNEKKKKKYDEWRTEAANQRRGGGWIGANKNSIQEFGLRTQFHLCISTSFSYQVHAATGVLLDLGAEKPSWYVPWCIYDERLTRWFEALCVLCWVVISHIILVVCCRRTQDEWLTTWCGLTLGRVLQVQVVAWFVLV
jgi:hypothetical protein